MNDWEIISPKPCALIESLRSVGYTLPTAVADILDNSITAHATSVWIDFHWSGEISHVSILDDGDGMNETELINAMRPGSMNPLDNRGPDDLGRFGLGLKTASFSQCRKLTVWTKSSGVIHGRCWDLDYVAKHDEWRLKKAAPPNTLKSYEKFRSLKSGTLVLWEDLDRTVDGSPSSSTEAQTRFLSLVQDVHAHLAMIFHRFLEGTTTSARSPLKIFLNGDGKGNLIQPWNPFVIDGAPNPKESPLESITIGENTVYIRGFVLPHKDRLTEQQFRVGCGPNGWIAQQGFYIYRNDRILVAGDWLRLGRTKPWAKEEQYKLARLSLDIPNSMDHEWSLDIKKSTARPPAPIRERLTDLAETIRNDGRQVFSHRGENGPKPGAPSAVIDRPWCTKKRSDRIVYQINRKHPLIESAITSLGPLSKHVEPMLRLIEETVPIQRIWLDTAESPDEHAIPYEGYDEDTLLRDIGMTCHFLSQSITSKDTLRAYLLAVEPFNRYPHSVDKVLKER